MFRLATLARGASKMMGPKGGVNGQQVRFMGGGGGQSNYCVTYNGVKLYLPAKKDVFIADMLGVFMWSWILVMLYEKGAHHFGPNHWDHYGLDMETDQLYHVGKVDIERDNAEAKLRDGRLGQNYRQGLMEGLQTNYLKLKSLGNPFRGWVNKGETMEKYDSRD